MPQPTTPSPLKRVALKGATWAAAGGNGAQALAFVMFVLISRMVGPEAFGAVAVCLLLVEMARALTIEPVAINLVARGKYQASEFHAGFALTGTLSGAATLLLIFAAPLFAILLSTPALASVLPQMAPLVVLHSAARLLEAELTLRLEFRALAIRSVGAVVLGGAAGIAAAYAGYGVEALVLQQWLGALAALALLALQGRWRPSHRFSRDSLVVLARESAVIAPAGVLSNMRQTIDGLAVAAFSGPAAAGAYNLAKRARLALQLGLSTAIGRVSLPTFAMVKEDASRMASALEQAMRLSAIVAFPIFIGVAAVAPELIAVFLGPEWSGAIAPMALLMITGAIAITTRLCENFLLVHNRRRDIVVINVIALAFLAASLALFGRFGPVAVAGAVMCTAIVQNIATWAVTMRRAKFLRLRTYVRNVWVPMSICVAMLALITAMRGLGAGAGLPEVLRLAAFVSLGVLFYFASTWIVARRALREAIHAGRIVLSSPRS